MQTLELKTWTCDNCGYQQDFDPANEELMAAHFRIVPAGNCPACFMGKNKTRKKEIIKMQRETMSGKKIKVSVLEDADIEKLEISEVDEAGNETKRKLTRAEQDKKKAERDQSLEMLQDFVDDE